MLTRIRSYRPSHATVVAYLALFVALGGSGYAAVTINGKNIKDGTIGGRKLKDNTLGGRKIAESKLGKVPFSANADTVGGLGAGAFLRTTGKAADSEKLDGFDSASFRDSCPAATTKFAGACFETAVRPVTNTLNGAGATCALAGARLPTFPELTAFATQTSATLGTSSSSDNQWEWTSEVYGVDPAGETVADRSGPLTYDSFIIATPLHFRCVHPLTN